MNIHSSRSVWLACAVFFLGACSSSQAQPAPSAQEALLVPFKKLIASKPGLSAGPVKIWTIEQTGTLRVNLVEMRGKLRAHKHPDAAHSLLVFEGSLRATVGGKVHVLQRGDFISIPAGVVHGYEVIGESAMVISCDAPYYDPAKTVYAER